MSQDAIEHARMAPMGTDGDADRHRTEKLATQNLATQCRPIVHDLFRAQPWVYWSDFVLTAIAAYASALMYMGRPFGSWLGLVCLPIAAVLLYRLSMFLHEIVHFRQRQLPGFSLTWNLFAGIPLLMPSFLYESHLTHHNSHHYGTERDGEYLPLANGTVGYLMLFLSQVVYQPLFVFCRFLVGTPLSFVSPRLREWIHERASSLVINFSHRRAAKEQDWRSAHFWIEIACSLRAWALIVVILAGLAPWTRLPKLYLLACCSLSINHVRTMVAHRYRNDGREMGHDDQFHDSTNITGGWLTELWCPLGLRYHALHHLLPGIPYHNLGTAHSRLMAELPDDSPYRDVTYASFGEAITELLRSVRNRTWESSIPWRMHIQT